METINLEYKSLDDLSYYVYEDYIELYHMDIFVCNMFTFLDWEECNREYIIINTTRIYLDLITLK